MISSLRLVCFTLSLSHYHSFSPLYLTRSALPLTSTHKRELLRSKIEEHLNGLVVEFDKTDDREKGQTIRDLAAELQARRFMK